jgi:hypothetical protein
VGCDATDENNGHGCGLLASWRLASLLATSGHGVCECLCHKEGSQELLFVGVSETLRHMTYDSGAHPTFTAKVFSMFLSKVVKEAHLSQL